ncbi:MAG: UvrD-helicase domain-containing protein [Gemmatimonadota bacterium]|nr:UvrD-helicase domain-containing protein [Gemmatimonadota bacterium]
MSSLNPEQHEAVMHPEGPLLVLAGAGSGKTRVLTARVARLIEEGVPADRILAVTFTNKAAGEMRERIERLIGRSTRGLWIGTFHSIAARLLRREAAWTTRDRSFTIYDEDDSIRALKDVMDAGGFDPKRWSPKAVRNRISQAKNQLIGPSDYAPPPFDLIGNIVAEVYPGYEKILQRRNAFDFDDLLVESVRLLERPDGVGGRYAARFVHVLVDEYQDTNHAQYRMVRALASAHRNLCVVGDDDQSIYAWRGADVRNILDFERDFEGAHVVRLEQNYRSTASILEVANAVIACNVDRKPKRLRTERESGESIRVVRCGDERREAAWVAGEIEGARGRYGYEGCAVLYRTNAQSRAFEEAFRRATIPYRIIGGVPFYDRREIKDILAYLRLAVNPADDAAFQRAIGWPRRGVGQVSLERLAAAATLADEPLFAAAARARSIEGLPKAAVRGLTEFVTGIEVIRSMLAEASAREALEKCVATFGLATALAEEEDGADRLENVSELFATAAAFDREDVDDAEDEATDLELYLQTVALRSDLDDADFEGEAVTLMTLHNAKGLEFPVVFLAGMEEGLFPLSRAIESEGGLEEERRLFYVGVTRAEDRLSLTHADRRWRAGMESHSAASSFLDELPDGHVERVLGGGVRGRSGSSSSRGGSYGASYGSSRRARPAGDRFGSNGGGRERGSQAAPGGSAFGWHREAARGSTSGDGELEYDYADSQEPVELTAGSRIIHPRFGVGEIVTISGLGRDAKAEIEFEEVGRKKVLVAYAGLRPA